MEHGVTVIAFVFFAVFVGYTIQSISGFGAVIFALPLSLIVLDRMEILPVFLMMSTIQSFMVAYRDKKYIMFKEYIIMFFLASLGMPIGIYITELVDPNIMNILLGAFIIINSGMNLYKTIKKKDLDTELLVRPQHRIYPILSGVLQSAYGIGGPLISMYMDKVTHDKRTYRGMLSLFWCMLNPFIIVGYLFRGEIGTSHIKMLMILFPAVLCAIFIGNRIIDHISKEKFQLFVHGLLIVIGCTMFI
ncbi:MAG: sulfite exporter TauE/SafE family protein [Firmicutes bacterium]|jgi:uncharacterized membrane protein YfcA|nr:sulfite exporter TauE/SafE family protein [Bacillota bacterium]